MKHFSLKTAVLLTLLFSCLGTAGAEELPDFELDQVVVTATRTPVSLRKSGANMSVVTREEIAEKHYRNVADALRQVSGVQITSYGYPGGINTVYINGSDRVLILLDGKRMNRPDNGKVDLVNLVGTDNIEKIEVLKGAGSALYGSDAAAGVINIITRKDGENKTRLDVAFGNSDRRTYGLSNSGSEGKLSWFLNYRDEHSGDFKSGKHTDSNAPGVGERRDYSSYDGKSYNASLSYQLNEKNKLNFVYQGYDNKAEYPGSLSWPSKSWGNDKLNSYDLSWDSQYSDKLQAAFRLYNNNIHYYGGNRDDNFGDYDYRMRVKGAEYQLNAALNEDHLLTGGLEWRRDEVVSSSIEPDTKKNDNKAVYLQDQWKISSKLTLTPGVRYDKHEEYGSYTSPKVVANYQADEKTNFYASWGKFFIAPNFVQLYYKDSYGNYGNPNLKPEKGRSWEIGVNHQFDKTTLGRLNYFDRRTEDKIKWVSDPVTWAGTYENVDKEKARGLEVEIKKQYSEELSASLAYNWLDVKNSNNGSAYERDYDVPRNSWKIALDYEKDRVKAGIAGRFLKDRRGNKNFPEKTYWVWDADVNYQINSDISAYLAVKNILDQYYQEYSGYPAAGRTLLFGLQYSF